MTFSSRAACRKFVCWAFLATQFAACPAFATLQLGDASTFAVLAGSALTNSGASVISGDIGVYPGTAATGLGTVTQTGSVHLADTAALLALASATQVQSVLAAVPSTTDLSGQDLGSLGILSPGTYHFATSAVLTGALTLDFGNHPDQPFIFQIGTALTTGPAATLDVINAGPRSAIYWNVGTSATLAAGTQFAGNVIAAQSITLGSGVRIVCGRAIAINAAVTMIADLVSKDCGRSRNLADRGDGGSNGFAGGTGSIPEPDVWLMMIFGFGAAGAATRVARLGAVSRL